MCLLFTREETVAKQVFRCGVVAGFGLVEQKLVDKLRPHAGLIGIRFHCGDELTWGAVPKTKRLVHPQVNSLVRGIVLEAVSEGFKCTLWIGVVQALSSYARQGS